MQPVSLTRSPELISGTIFTTVQAGYRVFSFPPYNIITAASTTLYNSRWRRYAGDTRRCLSGRQTQHHFKRFKG